MRTAAGAGGAFEARCIDRRGSERWRAGFRNAMTTEGANYLQNAGFRGGSQVTPFRIGLIDATGFSTVDGADTHASHAGWGEFTSLFGTDRAAWSPTAAATGVLTNPTATTLQATADGSLRGAFLASRAAVGDTAAGVLFCTAVAGSNLPVAAGDTIYLTYTLAAESVG